MRENVLKTDVLSYLIEVQELIDAEFGVTEIPDPKHNCEFTEAEYMVIYFALKSYMSDAIMQRTGGQIIIRCNKLLERMLPNVSQFTKNRIKALNEIRPTKTNLEELDYPSDSIPPLN